MISKPSPTASRTAASRAHVLATCGRPILILAPPKPLACALERILDQLGGLEVQPAALGVVERHALLGAAGQAMQRQACVAAAQVPQRGVDRGQRERGDRADRRGVGRGRTGCARSLDVVGVAADQLRREMVVAAARTTERAAGADRVAVARVR